MIPLFQPSDWHMGNLFPHCSTVQGVIFQWRRGRHAPSSVRGGAPQPQLHDDPGALLVRRRVVSAALAARDPTAASGITFMHW